MAIRVIITGSTGMVGEGVLHEGLLHSDVASVLVINRRPCGVTHLKLREIIQADFSDFSGLERELAGYNAAFLCMGTSSVGMKEEQYRHVTYDCTLALARPLSRLNPEMTVTYVSGAGTDSTEQGRSMWARVKGKTENDLMKLPFRQAFMFRPAYMQPTQGLKRAWTIAKIIAPLFPLWKLLLPNYVCTLQEVGVAMINAVTTGFTKKILDTPDIIALARLSPRT